MKCFEEDLLCYESPKEIFIKSKPHENLLDRACSNLNLSVLFTPAVAAEKCVDDYNSLSVWGTP